MNYSIASIKSSEVPCAKTLEASKKAIAAFNLAKAIEFNSGTGPRASERSHALHLAVDLAVKELDTPERYLWLEWCAASTSKNGATSALQWLRSGWDLAGLLPKSASLRTLARARQLWATRPSELANIFKFTPIDDINDNSFITGRTFKYDVNMKNEPAWLNLRLNALSITRRDLSWIPKIKDFISPSFFGAIFAASMLLALLWLGLTPTNLFLFSFLFPISGSLLGIIFKLIRSIPFRANEQDVLSSICNYIYPSHISSLETLAWASFDENPELGFESIAKSLEESWRHLGGSKGHSAEPLQAFFDANSSKVSESLELSFLLAQKESLAIDQVVIANSVKTCPDNKSKSTRSI